MRFRSAPKNLDASTREDILNVAQKVFADVGFKEATVRQICKAAKANVCLISYYFGGKDGLYQAIFERVAKARSDVVQEILANTSGINTQDEFRLRLQMFLDSMYRGMTSRPDFFRLMHHEISEGLPRAEEVIKNFMGPTLGVFESYLEFGQKKKFVKKDLDIHLTCLMLINTFLGFCAQTFGKTDLFFKNYSNKDLPHEIIKTVTSIFLDGVRQ